MLLDNIGPGQDNQDFFPTLIKSELGCDLLQSGASGCEKCFVKCFLKVPLAC